MKRFLKRINCRKAIKGFSLVEVLCAVVLLALVATPILQCLYSGMVVNNKSRKMLAASDLASDTLEFISSLSFEDYSYKVSGVETPVPGLKSYYWGNTTEGAFITKSKGILYPGKKPSDDPFNPNPVYIVPATWVEAEYLTDPKGKFTNVPANNIYYGSKVTFKDVKNDGYDFKVIIETHVPDTKIIKPTPAEDDYFKEGDMSSEKYFCYDVTVTVIDQKTDKTLTSASTMIPNKF